jgi:hypothetical protein
MDFDVAGARQAGYSDAEIASHLAETTKFDAEGARKAGYSDQEIIGQLTTPAKPEYVAPSEYGPAPTRGVPEPDLTPAANAVSSIRGAREALAPEPGYVRAPIPLLPLAWKETTPGSGEIDPKSGLSGLKFDLGAALSPLLSPFLDLLEGTGLATSMGGQEAPLAGKVSPAATTLLAGTMMGSPVRQFRDPLARSETGVATSGDLQFGPPDARPPSTGVFGVGGDVRAAPLGPEFTAHPLSPEGRVAATVEGGGTPTAPSTPTGIPVVPPKPLPPEPPTAAPEGGGGPSPGMGARSAGAAATPGYEAIHTPAEEAAYRATAEGQKLLEPQKIGEPDLNQYIPGETVNNAEREQTAKAARELKELGIRVPEASQIDKEAAESNNTARRIYAENTARGPVEIANRRTQRQTDIEADKAAVFAPENIQGPVDIKPVIADMEAVLNDPFNRQNTALQQAYKPWLERLKGFKDGVIDDPREAWGLRYDIDQQTDKFATRDNPNMHRVAHQLNEAAGGIDRQINNVAPGYDDMLAKYKEHSRGIDEMTVLQDMFDKLRGPGQRFTYNDFQRFMKNVVDSRMTPSTDLNPFKAISDENMVRLWNLRDSLRRTASAKELAQAAGSDTMANIVDSLKAIAKVGGMGAAHAYVAAHLGPGGNLALQSLMGLGKTLNERRTIRRATDQMRELMNPSEPLRLPPGQENPVTRQNPLGGAL